MLSVHNPALHAAAARPPGEGPRAERHERAGDVGAHRPAGLLEGIRATVGEEAGSGELLPLAKGQSGFTRALGRVAWRIVATSPIAAMKTSFSSMPSLRRVVAGGHRTTFTAIRADEGFVHGRGSVGRWLWRSHRRSWRIVHPAR